MQESFVPSTTSPIAPITPNLRSKGPSHPCNWCGRVYERADHLNRHLTSHRNTRPHKCTRCPKRFNRVDLLHRHQAAHDRQGSDKRSIERGDRVAAACVACVSAKAKCQDQKPCVRCQRRGITCDVPASSIPIAAIQPDSISEIPYLENQTNLPPTISNRNSTFAGHPLSLPSNLPSTFLDHQDFSYLPNLPKSPANPNPPIPHPNFLTDMYGGHQDTYFSQDLDFGVWDIDIDSVEMSFAAFGDASAQSSSSVSNATDPQTESKHVSKRYAAFERSPWLWTPTQKDQALNGHHNLNLDEEVIPAVLTPGSSPAAEANEFSSCCIEHRQRDQMLSLLFTLRSKQPRPIPRFPSLSLLNSIIQVHFMQENFRFDSLVHVGNFSPSKALPQLLLAIVSAGSALIAIPAIWKMGLALQEIVRFTVGEYWEEDNRNTRDLQALQAFMIALDIGLWSGYRRNMELAESFGQPIVIMLRRAGAFAASSHQEDVIPSYNDSQVVLESKWGRWVKQESFKRLVLHIFIHDIHASIGLQKPPLMTFTELKLSLPSSRAIWSASSATEWRDVFLSTQGEDPAVPSFMEAMQHPEALHRFASRLDIHFAAMILLHGYWGQIFSLIESKKFFPVAKSTHRLAVHTSATELYRDFASFSQHLPSLTSSCSEASLLSELFLMVLQISPEDLQRFAGKFGEDEARKAGQEFAEWTGASEARIAIWHAGQILRTARVLPPARIRGFNAVALYFATLTLWVYGLMSQPRPPADNSRVLANSFANSHQEDRSHQERVSLNGHESLQAQVFRSCGQGSPGLTIKTGETEQFLELKDADKILTEARDIYRKNYPGSNEPLPPLVENLGNLLRDLGTLPSSYGSRMPSPTPE